MKDAPEFVKSLISLNEPWLIVMSVIIALPYLIKLLKDISTISHTIEVKNIEGFSLSIVDENSSAAKYKLEKYFAQLYKRSFSYKEIKYLLSFESPSTAIKDYIWGYSYLNYEDNKVNYRKNYWFNAITWFNGAFFILSSLCGVVSIVLLLVGFTLGSENEILINFGIVIIYCFFISWLTLKGSRDVNAARRVVERQPKKLTKIHKIQAR
ncbi:hypothetical protein L2744_21175 [Shewanella profunda]|uniref:hypothetical protein n=1 Tax=Shewanella profunda TaxID=254793 RepID=UPI00200E6939|nr:hypothetical protein [Shewanella profunda]MCL1092064.1 hypothetical protein [Shewanella profunda]